MVRRSLGKLSKRTRLLKRSARRPLTIKRKLSRLKVGDKVHLTPISTPSMPHPRYRGRTGSVIGLRGRAYVVEITDYNATKRLIIEGVHLTKVK